MAELSTPAQMLSALRFVWLTVESSKLYSTSVRGRLPWSPLPSPGSCEKSYLKITNAGVAKQQFFHLVSHPKQCISDRAWLTAEVTLR